MIKYALQNKFNIVAVDQNCMLLTIKIIHYNYYNHLTYKRIMQLQCTSNIKMTSAQKQYFVDSLRTVLYIFI